MGNSDIEEQAVDSHTLLKDKNEFGRNLTFEVTDGKD